jgi:hypothetical protein
MTSAINLQDIEVKLATPEDSPALVHFATLTSAIVWEGDQNTDCGNIVHLKKDASALEESIE